MRRPTEIGQSEKLVGDIRSTGKSKERIIEVKGTSKKPEEFSIDLKKNQSRNIFLRDTTHLYIVCDALSIPHLFVLTSDTIDGLSDHRISVVSSKWNNRDVWEDNWLST